MQTFERDLRSPSQGKNLPEGFYSRFVSCRKRLRSDPMQGDRTCGATICHASPRRFQGTGQGAAVCLLGMVNFAKELEVGR